MKLIEKQHFSPQTLARKYRMSTKAFGVSIAV